MDSSPQRTILRQEIAKPNNSYLVLYPKKTGSDSFEYLTTRHTWGIQKNYASDLGLLSLVWELPVLELCLKACLPFFGASDSTNSLSFSRAEMRNDFIIIVITKIQLTDSMASYVSYALTGFHKTLNLHQ